jgi:hypothetical protein
VPAFVKADGTLVDIDGSSTTINLHYIPGTYHIAIRHRNHLGVMTNTALDFSGASATASVDFTVTSPTHGVYGTNGRVEAETGVWAMWAGDVNGDGKIYDATAPSDADEVAFGVLFHPNNINFVANFIGYTGVYDPLDVDLDGSVFDVNLPSDADLIRFSVLFHPLNTTYLSNFVGFMAQLP